MATVKVGDSVIIFRKFTVVKDLGNNQMDVCDHDGNCLRTDIGELRQIDMKLYDATLKNLVEQTAKKLMKPNGTTTTLEIKNEVRKKYPQYFIDQKMVSDYMIEFANNSTFNYSDNGTYRIYKTPQKTSQSFASKPSKTAVSPADVVGLSVKRKGIVKQRYSNMLSTNTAFNLLKEQRDKFQEATIVTKNGNKVVSNQDIRNAKKSPVSYLQGKELFSLKIDNQLYQITD